MVSEGKQQEKLGRKKKKWIIVHTDTYNLKAIDIYKIKCILSLDSVPPTTKSSK